MLSPAAPMTQQRTQKLDEEPLHLDEEWLNELSDQHEPFNPVFARASAPRQRGEALRAISQVPPEAITH